MIGRGLDRFLYIGIPECTGRQPEVEWRTTSRSIDHGPIAIVEFHTTPKAASGHATVLVHFAIPDIFEDPDKGLEYIACREPHTFNLPGRGYPGL